MKPQTVTVDFDNFRERINEARQCLLDFLPCEVRISAGRLGLHIKKTCYNEIEHSHALSLRTKYDDPKRLLIDRLRAEKGLTGEILLRKKCIGQDTKEAGEWVHFNRVKDAMNIEVLLCR
jgi:hypothetical protein